MEFRKVLHTAFLLGKNGNRITTLFVDVVQDTQIIVMIEVKYGDTQHILRQVT